MHLVCLFFPGTFPGNSSAYHESRATRLSMLVYIGFQCDTRRLIQERCAARETGSRHSFEQDVECSTYECCWPLVQSSPAEAALGPLATPELIPAQIDQKDTIKTFSE